VAMPLRSGLMFRGVVPQVGGCWGCRNGTAVRYTLFDTINNV